MEREQWDTAMREATMDAERAKQALADSRALAKEASEIRVSVDAAIRRGISPSGSICNSLSCVRTPCEC